MWCNDSAQYIVFSFLVSSPMVNEVCPNLINYVINEEILNELKTLIVITLYNNVLLIAYRVISISNN